MTQIRSMKSPPCIKLCSGHSLRGGREEDVPTDADNGGTLSAPPSGPAAAPALDQRAGPAEPGLGQRGRGL